MIKDVDLIKNIFISLLMKNNYIISKITSLNNTVVYKLEYPNNQGNIYSIEGYFTIDSNSLMDYTDSVDFRLIPMKYNENNLKQIIAEHKDIIQRLFEVAVIEALNIKCKGDVI